jgi:hypothetical protein
VLKWVKKKRELGHRPRNNNARQHAGNKKKNVKLDFVNVKSVLERLKLKMHAYVKN